MIWRATKKEIETISRQGQIEYFVLHSYSLGEYKNVFSTWNELSIDFVTAFATSSSAGRKRHVRATLFWAAYQDLRRVGVGILIHCD